MVVVALLLALDSPAAAPPAPPPGLDPEIARLLERAVHEAETLRLQLRTMEYDADMRVQEWDARGELRGKARARAIMRPGAEQPMTFLSREIEGTVKLPDPDKRSRKKKRDDKGTNLHEFAEEHHIAERYEFTLLGTDTIAGQRARRVAFKPKPNQPRQNTADRFLDTITGIAWVSEEKSKLLKFEMRLLRPFQLFWIFAVLRELEIRYELLVPGDVLGRAKLQVKFALTTPVSSLRQQHDVEIDNFRRRTTPAAVAATFSSPPA